MRKYSAKIMNGFIADGDMMALMISLADFKLKIINKNVTLP